jgi:outer membrane lipoprotein-sorting protein
MRPGAREIGLELKTAIGRKAAWTPLARCGVLIAGMALVLASEVVADAAVRDPVPLPRPNPFVTASASDPQSSEPSGLRKLFGKKPRKSSGPSPFTPEQQVALANITDYFNSFRTMQGEFVQVGPRGEQSEGVFVISKPGKVRFHYKPPVKLDVIADGRSIAIRDNKANTQDLYPLSKTPLRYLLAEDVDLTSSKIVDRVNEDSDLISLLIEERSALVEGKLTLIFDRKSYELRQWIVTDAQGLNTSVAIFNTVTGKKPDPALFKIYLTPKKPSRPDR